MRAVNLAEKQHTVAELLELAESEPVYIRAADGKDFLLEPADVFEREAAELGSSEKFLSFLRSRSAENEDSSAEEVAGRLGLHQEREGE
jgi:hypothetical protein